MQYLFCYLIGLFNVFYKTTCQLLVIYVWLRIILNYLEQLFATSFKKVFFVFLGTALHLVKKTSLYTLFTTTIISFIFFVCPCFQIMLCYVMLFLNQKQQNLIITNGLFFTIITLYHQVKTLLNLFICWQDSNPNPLLNNKKLYQLNVFKYTYKKNIIHSN